MNDSDSLLKYNPFETLGTLLKEKAVPPPLPIKKPGIVQTGQNLKPEVPIKKRGIVLTGQYQTGDVPIQKPVAGPAEVCATSVNEESAFREAMEGVKPLVKDKRHEKKNKGTHPLDHLVDEPEREARRRLDNLLKYGEGFIISQTPEYMEGIGRDIPPKFAERLHRGDFSIQAHLDLHGMGVAQARDAFENFLHEALMSGKRAVLIIHGRGISSPGEPVLKNKVSEWLTRSHWRKRVIVFTSAQSYDGGAGATYVLLRHRLTSKRSGKNPTGK
ncbi:MAG: Smr/MutS family protein [Deltaproteobacteria bacterium]|nr:Smr/MutS family protein [Deltaproteobacteria bacterium]